MDCSVSRMERARTALKDRTTDGLSMSFVCIMNAWGRASQGVPPDCDSRGVDSTTGRGCANSGVDKWRALTCSMRGRSCDDSALGAVFIGSLS
ncbi:JM88 [macacine gammaherpesvirus 11]|uniref:JM88 n=2 Tax=macacine gammaherpesvirus 11 TaxID=2560570 RepID=G9JM96_9GAMA|nr:JM88 [Macaca fuscata rhadinovirus]AAT00065.1 JM88 [Macaca fuscata rhadinovirus]AEW87613.1 JM88 [Macaca fuscata rhadinovirus]AEW87783.1 JM88 [Macaca fuscata rhadinovirus]